MCVVKIFDKGFLRRSPLLACHCPFRSSVGCVWVSNIAVLRKRSSLARPPKSERNSIKTEDRTPRMALINIWKELCRRPPTNGLRCKSRWAQRMRCASRDSREKGKERGNVCATKMLDICKYLHTEVGPPKPIQRHFHASKSQQAACFFSDRLPDNLLITIKEYRVNPIIIRSTR